jgi:PAS domain S-box-containing protein
MTSSASRYPTPLEVSARACSALNGHDLDQLRSVLAEDVVEHVVPIGIYDGRQAVLAFHERLFAATPDFRVAVTHVAAAGDAVLAAWELSATFTGAPFERLRPNGRRVRLEGASSQVVREGRVASAEVIFDGASFARQVGMLPIRGSAADRAILAACNLRTRLQARNKKRLMPTDAGESSGRSSRRVDDPFERRRAAVGPEDLEDLLQRQELAVIATDLVGVVTHWSAGAERLYGWSSVEVLGRPITELTVGPEDEKVAENIMQWVRQTGRWEGEFWVRRKDGFAFLAYVREAIVADDQGTPIGLVGVSIEAFLNGIDAPTG